MEEDGNDLDDEESREKLALEAKGGDREARNKLYFEYENLLRFKSRRARRIAEGFGGGMGPVLGEDVDQQGFLLFCGLLDSWEPEVAPFREHLERGAGWAALHYVRASLGYRRQRKVVRFTPQREEEREREPESEEAASEISQVEGRIALQAHSEVLDERWQRLIRMKFDEELTTGEIAVIDGHSRRTVNRELRSAMDAVRAQLEEWWEDCG